MVAGWDQAVVEALQDLHGTPLDRVFVLLSDWWVKSLLILGVGLVADLVSRRWFPLAAALGTASYFAAALLTAVLKAATDRPRPPVADPDIDPLVRVPHSSSMPSGHAATAFAAAVAVGLVHPRLRWPLVSLAALIAFSRVWIGVHYPSDVIVGAALGTGVALALWHAARAIIGTRTSSP